MDARHREGRSQEAIGAERAKLMEAKMAKQSDKLPQPAAVSRGGRGNKGGTRAAARQMNVSRDKVRRAKRIDSLSDEARRCVHVTIGCANH